MKLALVFIRFSFSIFTISLPVEPGGDLQVTETGCMEGRGHCRSQGLGQADFGTDKLKRATPDSHTPGSSGRPWSTSGSNECDVFDADYFPLISEKKEKNYSQ